jgi:MYXO-CTERM domain-containing protein
VRRALALAALLLADAAAGAGFRVERVATGLVLPVYAVSPPGETARVFVLEQHTGRIRIVRPLEKTVDPDPFLELAAVATDGEQGLLGLAFHPDYASNGVFFVSYTDPSWATNVVRYTVSADPDVADPESAELVLRLAQPQTNHNGGWIGFGPEPDGALYVPLGDGGGGHDDDAGHTPAVGNGQDPGVLLGKILRLDVEGDDDYPADDERNYAIPPDNPFVGEAGVLPEIWALGLRNPWRASFDRETGDLWLGDVGQDTREEIDFQPAASPGGENYGWRLREGTQVTPNVGGAEPEGHVNPVYEYAHAPGSCQTIGGSGSVTGGYAYRGPVAELQGLYFFGDFCQGFVRSLRFDGSDPADFDGTNFDELTTWTGTPEFAPDAGSIGRVASFGEDGAGNLYVVDYDGDLFRVPEPAGPWPAVLALAGAALLARRRPRRHPHRFW